ncbi:microsomal signal peptidase 25 kDa subunit [Toxoplasma gondii p89]|uniref:Signal peptidase complex subunit 2 n=1 Tax=Toxoplasma gondii p89 TaxID=943119 RepID=A0A086L1V9_TOXGO|nr:microsomal signal peptidase 25 kDa subunit [Toxoplasma gondii p89]
MAGKGKEEQAAAAPVASVPEENSASSATDEYQAEEEEEQKRLQSILSNMRRVSNLYSEMELLRVVEDYVTDCMVHLGYQEHRLFSNIRLLVATFACCIAAYASFGIPVATDGPSLKLSIAAFFGSLLVLLLVETLWVKNAIACFKDKDGDCFFIDSHIDRSSNELVLAIRQKSLHLSTASNVGRFFDSKGYLLIDTLYEELTKLLQDFENGLTDTAKKVARLRRKKNA